MLIGWSGITKDKTRFSVVPCPFGSKRPVPYETLGYPIARPQPSQRDNLAVGESVLVVDVRINDLSGCLLGILSGVVAECAMLGTVGSNRRLCAFSLPHLETAAIVAAGVRIRHLCLQSNLTTFKIL
ncbi:hypothetical protein TM7_0327 [candidate division TM7 genomosp. GTL1]|nr:hypothetical protein TM7_0327 [candidate division TM7 genomosp. GTL1]